jgi:hypothetical protein
VWQLKIVLSAADSPDTASTGTSPHYHLHELYLPVTVLREAFLKASEHPPVGLQAVLGTIVVIFDPFAPETMEALLNLDKSTVRSLLRRLHSIAIVPDTGGSPIQLLHPSFCEFLFLSAARDANISTSLSTHCVVICYLRSTAYKCSMVSHRICARLGTLRSKIKMLPISHPELSLTYRPTCMGS